MATGMSEKLVKIYISNFAPVTLTSLQSKSVALSTQAAAGKPLLKS